MARVGRRTLALALAVAVVREAAAFGAVSRQRSAGTASASLHLRSSRSAAPDGSFAIPAQPDGVFAEQQTDTGTQKICSCDCCVSRIVSRAANGGSNDANGSLVCVLRSEGPQSDEGSEQCPQTCEVDGQREAAEYNAVTPQVDYQRFCLHECLSAGRPFGKDGVMDETLLCAPKSSFEKSQPPAPIMQNASDPVVVEAPQVPQVPQAFAMPTTMAPATVTPFKVTSAMLAMAKSKMEEARKHAEAAGRSAKAARMAYEAALASATAMGKAAAQEPILYSEGRGKTMLPLVVYQAVCGFVEQAQYNEMEKAAAEQAWETFQIRQRYIRDSQVAAQKAALDAAAVYEKAKQRDLARAGEWAQRAGEYKTAARERGNAAEDAALEAIQFKVAKQLDVAKDYAARAQAAEDQSERYIQMSKSAQQQALAIENTAKEYDTAAEAAAKFMMARALPPDVPPPALPMVR
mmetsp:Transcript_47676/g.137236  ORF Transcript_47676/g.137236 Transcript_47676/m.137236 type:complete len:463 (+) Transcript_47676:65-1453(+)